MMRLQIGNFGKKRRKSRNQVTSVNEGSQWFTEKLENLKRVQKIKKSSSALWCRGPLSPNADANS
jgi:hypothetical protein